MKLKEPIQVTYESTDDFDTARDWLTIIDASDVPYIACDFEAAVKYSPDEIADFKRQLEDENLDFYTRIDLQQRINATPLSHNSHHYPTHISIATSDNFAYVIIIHTFEILHLVLDWLVETEVKQIWHNASYDFQHIYYHTGKFPKDYEDSALLAKTLLNHVETHKAKVGLKELAGEHYGAWAVSADSFTVDQMYEPYMLLYAATDACATCYIWEAMNQHLEED